MIPKGRFQYSSMDPTWFKASIREKYENLAIYRSQRNSDYHRDILFQFMQKIRNQVPKLNLKEAPSPRDIYKSVLESQEPNTRTYYHLLQQVGKDWQFVEMNIGIIPPNKCWYCTDSDFKDEFDAELKKLYEQVIYIEPHLEFDYTMCDMNPESFYDWKNERKQR